MAAITPKEKNGKVVSYRFRACVGRDEMGKQIFRSTTWIVPDGLTPARAAKAAQRAAVLWEREADKFVDTLLTLFLCFHS